MSSGKPKNGKPARKSLPKRKPTEWEQIKTDLAGLEKLHALQSTLISEIRKQVDGLRPKEEK